MLLEEQHNTSKLKNSFIQPDAAVKWIKPDWESCELQYLTYDNSAFRIITH
jgi:hypothetical protein